MFNGTARHPQGEFDRLMEAQGASNNAYTSQDVTVYQDWFPRAALELVFELESDRMAQPGVRSRGGRERAQGGVFGAPAARR